MLKKGPLGRFPVAYSHLFMGDVIVEFKNGTDPRLEGMLYAIFNFVLNKAAFACTDV